MGGGVGGRREYAVICGKYCTRKVKILPFVNAKKIMDVIT